MKEAVRLFFRLFGFGRQVEGYELVVREQPSEGGGLAGLAGAGKHYHRTGSSGASQARLDLNGVTRMGNANFFSGASSPTCIAPPTDDRCRPPSYPHDGPSANPRSL